jgi:hypothetical protein
MNKFSTFYNMELRACSMSKDIWKTYFKPYLGYDSRLKKGSFNYYNSKRQVEFLYQFALKHFSPDLIDDRPAKIKYKKVPVKISQSITNSLEEWKDAFRETKETGSKKKKQRGKDKETS